MEKSSTRLGAAINAHFNATAVTATTAAALAAAAVAAGVAGREDEDVEKIK